MTLVELEMLRREIERYINEDETLDFKIHLSNLQETNNATTEDKPSGV